MAGGLRDSSLTRVRPTVQRLVEQDASDASWLLPPMQLGSRSTTCRAIPPRPGHLQRAPQFERPCPAPEDLLRWLIDHTPELDARKLEAFAGSEVTGRRRRALFAGDAAVRAEAQARLVSLGRRPGRGQWHVLEGETMVDCAVFAENVTLFIEGKRTEQHLTERVTWLPTRNQVVRNLDCLRVDPDRAPDWYVLLVVEDGTAPVLEARQLDEGGAMVAKALPHLAADQVQEIWSHYLGYTTWQAIRDRFQLGALPETTRDL